MLLKRLFSAIALVSLVGLSGLTVFDARAAGEEGTLDALGHTADGIYLDFSPIAKVELPRIFLVRRASGDLGLDVFSGTKKALQSGMYQGFAKDNPDVAASTDSLIASKQYIYATLKPVEGALLIDFSITRHLLFAILAATLVSIITISIARRYARGIGRETAPKGLLHNLVEGYVMFIRDGIAKPNIGEKYERFMPYLLTVFAFIYFCNMLGLVPWGATATANISVTAVLALFTFFITNIYASKDHWMHILWPPGVPAFVKPILIPVEILGLFTKPFALAIRLFANLTAGHLIILSLIGLIFTFGKLFGPTVGYAVSPISMAFTLFIYLLELLVAFLQAFVFTMLSSLFIGMAVAEHHHDEHAEAHH